MGLSGERVKSFFEWFLFFVAIFVAITIFYILLALLLEIPRYIKDLVKYGVEYVTRRRVWMRRTQLTEATGGVGRTEGGGEDRLEMTQSVVPAVGQVIQQNPNRRDDQGRRNNTGPTF
uniref:Movement protein n=1 Tax=Cardamom bushy dwarf virus TaxID=262588 RepID=W0G167_9VIRU|nr:movement protein [Cardamom bushy dwarf virus]